MSDLIDRDKTLESVTDAISAYIPLLEGDAIKIPLDVARVIMNMPSAGPDKAVIDNLLFNINSSISPHASTTSVISIKHCIQALYEEIYGEGAKPKWMI